MENQGEEADTEEDDSGQAELVDGDVRQEDVDPQAAMELQNGEWWRQQENWPDQRVMVLCGRVMWLTVKGVPAGCTYRRLIQLLGEQKASELRGQRGPTLVMEGRAWTDSIQHTPKGGVPTPIYVCYRTEDDDRGGGEVLSPAVGAAAGVEGGGGLREEALDTSPGEAQDVLSPEEGAAAREDDRRRTEKEAGDDGMGGDDQGGGGMDGEVAGGAERGVSMVQDPRPELTRRMEEMKVARAIRAKTPLFKPRMADRVREDAAWDGLQEAVEEVMKWVEVEMARRTDEQGRGVQGTSAGKQRKGSGKGAGPSAAGQQAGEGTGRKRTSEGTGRTRKREEGVGAAEGPKPRAGKQRAEAGGEGGPSEAKKRRKGALPKEVEGIVAERRGAQGKEYRVHWRGYAEDFNSWEPQESLAGCQRALREWKERKRVPVELDSSSEESSGEEWEVECIMAEREGPDGREFQVRWAERGVVGWIKEEAMEHCEELLQGWRDRRVVPVGSPRDGGGESSRGEREARALQRALGNSDAQAALAIMTVGQQRRAVDGEMAPEPPTELTARAAAMAAAVIAGGVLAAMSTRNRKGGGSISTPAEEPKQSKRRAAGIGLGAQSAPPEEGRTQVQLHTLEYMMRTEEMLGFDMVEKMDVATWRRHVMGTNTVAGAATVWLRFVVNMKWTEGDRPNMMGAARAGAVWTSREDRDYKRAVVEAGRAESAGTLHDLVVAYYNMVATSEWEAGENFIDSDTEASGPSNQEEVRRRPQ